MSKEQQRGRKERFIVIPFSSTCRSASSVDVVQSNKPQPQGASREVTSAAPAVVGKPAKPESLSLVARLLRGFKNLSHQIFAVYDDEDEEEEEEQEMVIGLPTDVKHVAHIGWDGSTSTTTSLRSWNRAAPPSADAASTSSSAAAPTPPTPSQAQEPALSVRQFELAMAAQASAASTSAAATAAASTSGSGASSTARRHRHYS